MVFISVPGLPEELVLISDDEVEASRGKANPKVANDLLHRELGGAS